MQKHSPWGILLEPGEHRSIFRGRTFIAFCLPEDAAYISPLMEVTAARYPTTSSFLALIPEWFNKLPLPLMWAMPSGNGDIAKQLDELSRLDLALLEAILTHTMGDEQAAQIPA